MAFRKQIRILVLLLAAVFAQAPAQTPYFIHHKVLKTRRGYASQVICQDREGFIWIGTSEGLILYDGVDFKHFTQKDGMAGTSITAICQDSTGRFWIGHENGRISNLDHEVFSVFMPEEGLGKIPVTDILIDSEGWVWFSTLGEGIYYYTGERLYNLDTDDGLADNYAYSLDSRDNFIDIGTDYGISIYSKKDRSFRHISMKDGIPDNIVKKVVRDTSGNLWAGTDEAGIFCVDPDGTITHYYNWNFGPVNDFVLDGRDVWISTDRSGVVELMSSEEGIFRYKRITREQGLMSNRTNSIFLDREKNLWIGTRDEVTQSVSSFFEFLDDRHGLPFRMVYDFLIDENEFYWVCTDSGLFKLTESEDGGLRAEKIFRGTPAEHYNFISLYADPQSYIWAGTYDQGVLRIDPATLSYRQYTTRNGLCDNNVISITANDRFILFSTLGGGVSQCELNNYPLRFRNLTQEYPEITRYVYQSLIDSRGRIWLAQDADHLNYIGDGKLFSFGEKDSLFISTVYSLLEDDHGNIWFSTSGEGVYRFDGKTFINYNENNGLSTADIRSMAHDPNGNLVIVSNEGIDVLDPESGQLQHFGDNYGVSYKDPQLNSIYRQRNGDIWIGTGNGLIKYRANALLGDTIRPAILLTGKELFSQEIEGDRHRFSHKQNHISFRYTGLWYQDPDRLRYRSMLEGYDIEWSSPTSTRDRTYSKLPPGTYRFRVETSLDNLTWIGSGEAEFAFTILPPFWRTGWFIASAIAAVLLLILAIFRIRLANLRRQKEELEREVARATEEIRNKNEELEAQKDEIESQRDLVVEQRDQIARQQEELQSSIRYAHNIQTAVRTPMPIVRQLIPECFILDRPRDIVSGDFYWVAEREKHIFFSVADCTGHGVPGAFMSMLGIGGFNEILSIPDCDYRADGFLNHLRDYVKKALHHTGEASDAVDGMDVSLCILDMKKQVLSFAGAFNPLYRIREGELTEYKGDKMPIGWHTRDNTPFTEKRVKVRKGDCLYLFSDGFADQFGGDQGKKYMYRKFKQLLLDIHKEEMTVQKETLELTLGKWMNDYEQVDDIMVMGVRI